MTHVRIMLNSTSKQYMRLDARKHAFEVCKQQEHSSVSASAQFGLCLYFFAYWVVSYLNLLHYEFTAKWGDGTYYIISFCVHISFGTQFEW